MKFSNRYTGLLALTLSISSCVKKPLAPRFTGSFTIYIVDDDVYAKENVNINNLKLIEKPLLSTSGIIQYNWTEHKITIKDSTYNRLLKINDLWRKGFVVCIGTDRIYWGLFQTDLDSYGGVVPAIYLSPKLPGRDFFLTNPFYINWTIFYGDGQSKVDPRSDIRIYNSLKSDGVLID